MTTTTWGEPPPAARPPAAGQPDASALPRAAGQPDAAALPRAAARALAVEIVVPVHNEASTLESSIRRLHALELPFPVRITIADNASTDDTWSTATALASELPGVHALHLPVKGRGQALRAAWAASDATVLAYMDVDLSTDLSALLPLVAPLLSGHSDLAIGTRLSRGSRVVRGAKRELISRCYNLLLRGTLAAKFSDAQCGFKAIRKDVADELLPLVEDAGWFFDTELLVLAERAGLRIHEVPVDWVDDPDSRVDIVATAIDDLRGIARLGRTLSSLPLAPLREKLGRADLPAGLVPQLVRFAGIGAFTTAVHLGLYAGLRGVLGAFGANLLSLLVATVVNTAANRRLTFGITGPRRRWQHQAEGLFVLGLGLALTTGALAGLSALVPDAGRAAELGALVAGNLAATVLRFLLFRAWVFHPRRSR